MGTGVMGVELGDEMNVLLSQKHYLVGRRLIEGEFYAGEFHDAACIRKTSLVRCGGCDGERRRKQGSGRLCLSDGRWNLGR